MGFLSSVWKYVAGALAAVSAILGALLLYTGNQRDRAKDALKVAKAQVKSTEQAREVEQNITKSVVEAQTKSAEVQREHESRPADTRPTGIFRR